MKYIIIILFVLSGFISVAQTRPTGNPSVLSTNGWYKIAYVESDSGLIARPRDTASFFPRFTGTIVMQPNIRKFYYYDSTDLRWYPLAGVFDTTSLSNRINLKLNISDTASMLSVYLRKIDTTNKWVQDIYSRNDSLFKYKNGVETFVDTLNGGSSGGGGTVTSVGLSLPSAFNVTPSTITTSGTFAVTGAGTTLQYIRGNGTLATFDTTAIPNFYLKVRGLLSGTSPITFSQITGAIGINNANTSGTKGAATFSSSSFSDNGSGLISLVDIVGASSCTSCNVTFDAKGRATSFSNGSGGGGSTDTAFNGLTKISDTIQLGGAFTKIDTLDAGLFHLKITGIRVGGGVLEVNNTASDYAATFESASSNTILATASTGNYVADFLLNSSTTNDVERVLKIRRESTGTPANGIGGAIDFVTESTAATTTSNSVVSLWTDATTGSRTSRLELWGVNNATTARKAAIAGTGQWTWDGYPALTQQTDTTNIKPIGYNTTTGLIQPMANWIGSGGNVINNTNLGTAFRWLNAGTQTIKTVANSNTILWDSTSTANSLTAKADTSVLATQYDLTQISGSFTAGNGIDITNNIVSQLFMPLKSNSIILGNSFAMGCCPDGTYTPYQDTLSTAFLNGPIFNNLSISGIGVRKGAYQLYTNFGEDHANMPILFEVGFNNTRILTDTAIHNATIQAAYRSMIASQFLIHIEGPNWGASGTNPNVTYSTAAAPASSEDTLLNWQSRLYWFRNNSINTGANWFNKASCNNDTITITNQIGSNLAFGTFGYAVPIGSRIKINIDGVDVVTYDPNNRTYTGQAEGFTPDGIIPDAIIVTGLANVAHIVKVIFLDNGLRGALDWFGTMCSAQESYDRPAYILAFPHMDSTGYNYPTGETNQGILDSATTGLKNMLRQTFPEYALAFVDINATGFYDPSVASQIDADGIHPTNEGHYNIAKAIYTKMLKTDKRGNVATLDETLAAGNTSARQILLTAQNSGLPSIEIGNDLLGQTFANSNSWFASNLYFNGTNFVYKHNGVGAQFYFNSGYIEEKTAASGSAGGTATINTRKVVTPTGDVWLGGDITNSVAGTGAKMLINGSTGNVTLPGLIQMTPVSGLGALTPLMFYSTSSGGAIAWYNSAGGTNEKVSDIITGSNTIQFRLGNDAYNSANDWLTVTRSGHTSAQVYFGLGEVNIGNATDQGAFTLQNTGGLYQNGVVNLNAVQSPPSTYTVLVHGLTDSIVYQVPSSTFGGITTLNTLTAATQTFATGTTGTDFNISSATSTHTFNIPSASTSNRGLVTTTSQTYGGQKTFNNGLISTSSSGPRVTINGNISVGTGPATSGDGIFIDFITHTNTAGAGTDADTQNFNVISNPTLTSSNAITYSADVATIRFVGAPIAAGSTTINHPWNILANDVNYFQTLAMGLNEQSGDATLGNGSIVIYSGSGGNTFTLPSLAAHPGKTYFIKNIGSGSVTIARAGSDNIYTTSSVTSFAIAAGAANIVSAASSFWVVQ